MIYLDSYILVISLNVNSLKYPYTKTEIVILNKITRP